jgi:hypothetical protein
VPARQRTVRVRGAAASLRHPSLRAGIAAGRGLALLTRLTHDVGRCWCSPRRCMLNQASYNGCKACKPLRCAAGCGCREQHEHTVTRRQLVWLDLTQDAAICIPARHLAACNSRVLSAGNLVTRTQRWLLKAIAQLSWIPYQLIHVAPLGARCQESHDATSSPSSRSIARVFATHVCQFTHYMRPPVLHEGAGASSSRPDKPTSILTAAGPLRVPAALVSSCPGSGQVTAHNL